MARVGQEQRLSLHEIEQLEIGSIEIGNAVVVGWPISIFIIVVDIITDRIVGDTFARVKKLILSLIVSIDKVFGNCEFGTQTSEMGTNVVCYHVTFVVVE